MERKMRIVIESHTLDRARERGTNENETIDAIENGSPIAGKYERLGKTKVFEYNKERAGKFYEQKRVEPITVYVFYGKWED